jgi:hypothetical protein
MHRSILICGLVLTLWPGLSRAAVVRGVTREAGTREPLGYVIVQLLGRSSSGEKVSLGMMSGSDGAFAFDPVAPGRYVLRSARVGFAMREDSLVVEVDREYRLDPALAVQPIQMDEIRVQARARPEVGDVQTGFVSTTADQLAALPGIAEGDPIRVLDLLPGVQAASDFSSALYVRGGGPDQTLVLLDGATVYNPTHAFGFFSTFNADATGDVNLYKGAYPAEHGGRLGAVLDVRSREARARDFSGKVGVSTIASRLSLDGGVGRGSWSLSGRRTHLDPLLNAIRSTGEEVPDYYFYDLNGKLTVPSSGGRVELSAYDGGDDLGFEPDDETFLDLNWGNRVVAGSWVRALSQRLVTTARVSYSEYRSNTTATAFTTPVAFENEVRDVSAAGELKWEAGIHHSLSTGLEASWYDVAFRQDFNLETVVDYRRKPVEVAAFASDRWTPWGETAIDAGARVRFIDDGDRWLFEPRIGLAQTVGENVRARVGGGIYHQYLQLVATEVVSAADFYVPLDETADVGRSWQLVGGADWRWRPSVLFSLEGYYTGLDHLVLLDNSTAGSAVIATADDLFYLNGTGYATGVELFARRDLGALTGWIGYTLGWTRRTFPDVNGGEEFPPKYDRRHDLSAAAQYERGKWRFTGSFVYATGQAFTPASGRYSLVDPTTGVLPEDIQLLYADKNSARLLPYNRLDLGVARRFSLFGARAEWLVEVFNVYSRRNEWFVQYQRDEQTVDADVVRMLPIIPSIGVNVWF